MLDLMVNVRIMARICHSLSFTHEIVYNSDPIQIRIPATRVRRARRVPTGDIQLVERLDSR